MIDTPNSVHDNPKKITITLGLVDGVTQTGNISAFAPDMKQLWLTFRVTNEPGQTEVSATIPTNKIRYIAFHKPIPQSEEAPVRPLCAEYDVRVTDKLVFSVKAEADAVSIYPGFYGIPISQSSPYTKIFFYNQQISFVAKEPLGSMLLKKGLVKEEQLQEGIEHQNRNRNTRLGEILVKHDKVSHQELTQAVTKQKSVLGPKMRLGEILIAEGLITQQDIDNALTSQRKQKGRRLGEILTELGFVSEEDIAKTLAKKFQLPFVDLDNVEIMPEAFADISSEMIQRYGVFPFNLHEGTLNVAISDPLAVEAVEMLRFSVQKKLREVMVSPGQLREYIETYVKEETHQVDDILVELEKETTGSSIKDNKDNLDDFDQNSESAIVRLVNQMIIDGYRQGASDIHIEPDRDSKPTCIRFRIDGICSIYKQIPQGIWKQLVGRIKIISGLDISETRKPQDGKIRFKVGNKIIELRVATMPTVGRVEDVVMRILSSGKPMVLNQMGFSEKNYENLKKLSKHSHGLILCVGPTGSGKTTTLHSLLGSINSPKKKIWTAEDPVEITQNGLRQVQVNPKIGFTFAAAMRSFLRADPDIIMVGEMRDTETAAIGIEASLTGHLVLSTLHTNSAPETVTRLIDMGIEPFTFSDALLGVLAQRLTRRLCSHCKASYDPSNSEVEEVVDYVGFDVISRFTQNQKLTFWRSKGCKTCNNTGYRGRLALHELLVNTDEISSAIQERAPVAQVRELAITAGMKTLLEDGIEKSLQGHTDLRQVLSVCQR